MFEKKTGKLKIFFSYADGVGKTLALLQEGATLAALEKKVVIAHLKRPLDPRAAALTEKLQDLSQKNGLDLDNILKSQPDLVIVDQLAASNQLAARNKKRYQDVAELLHAGIDVLTTLNVQHIDSLNDLVEELTGEVCQETIPDSFLAEAYFTFIDLEPEELLRLTAGSTSAAKLEQLVQLRSLAIQKLSEYLTKTPAAGLDQTKFLTVIDDRYPKMGEKCLRWTARIAQSLGSEWIVLQIRTANGDTSNSLAEKLGAQVLVIEAEDSFETIVEYAKMTGITDIVMGKLVNEKWRQHFLAESWETRFLKRLPETEIHLIPYQEKRQHAWEWRKFFVAPNWQDLLITCGGLLLATFLTELLQFWGLGDQNLMTIYIFFVLLIARFTAGYLWSALSAIISVLTFTWLFVEPLYSLSVDKQGYLITLIIMFCVALMISNLVARLKAKVKHSIEKEHQLEILYELSNRYMKAADEQQIFSTTEKYLSRLMNRQVILYNAQGQSAQQTNAPASEQTRTIVCWVLKNQKAAGCKTDTFANAEALFLPIIFEGELLGVLQIESTPAQPLAKNQLNYLHLVITQLAMTLEQAALKVEKAAIQLENERERVRSNLLRAVSHDLRTPLTAISGIAEMLSEEEMAAQLKPATKVKLLHDIRDESQWLIRMVENLLSVTRINMETMQVNKTDESVEEILESLLGRLKKAYPEKNLSVSLPDEFLIVHVDPILIEQALFNLVENAFRHGLPDQQVVLNVSVDAGKVSFAVSNAGKIPNTQLEKIQHNLNAADEVPVDSKNGLGIGIGIVKTIVHAHGGRLEMQTTDQTIFRFTL